MKITLIITLFLFFIGTTDITFAKSRLDRVDCGSRMSRLDAGKCEKIRLAKLRVRAEDKTHQDYPSERILTYDDGENDAWAGRPQKSYGGAYAWGYEDEIEREERLQSQ